MSERLKKKILDSCDTFLNTIYKLKEPIYNESIFLDTLLTLDKKFRRLINLTEIYNNNEKKQKILFKKIDVCNKNNKEDFFNILSGQESSIIETPNHFKNEKYVFEKINYSHLYQNTPTLEMDNSSIDRLFELDVNTPSDIIKDENITLYNHKDQFNDFNVVFHQKHGVLDIETGFMEINAMCFDLLKNIDFNKQIDSLEAFLELYWDIKWRKCDFCISFYNCDYEIPFCRKKDRDFVLAFHEKCINKSI
jgi:hypothetical protein